MNIVLSPEIVDNLWMTNEPHIELIVVIVVAAFAITTTLALIGMGKHIEQLFTIGLFGLVLVGFGALLASVFVADTNKSAVHKVQTEYLAKYGLEVRPSHWDDLELPLTKPDKATKFGTATAELNGKIVTIRTEWKDGEMKVYSTDGQELHPVKVKQ